MPQSATQISVLNYYFVKSESSSRRQLSHWEHLVHPGRLPSYTGRTQPEPLHTEPISRSRFATVACHLLPRTPFKGIFPAPLMRWELPSGFRLPTFHGGRRLLYRSASLQSLPAHLGWESLFCKVTCVCLRLKRGLFQVWFEQLRPFWILFALCMFLEDPFLKNFWIKKFSIGFCMIEFLQAVLLSWFLSFSISIYCLVSPYLNCTELT